jgi:hypothetical protein
MFRQQADHRFCTSGLVGILCHATSCRDGCAEVVALSSDAIGSLDLTRHLINPARWIE